MVFHTTCWDLVASASGGAAAGSEMESARAALEELCQIYRPPIFAFIRNHGYGEHAADDLTQQFFLGLVCGKLLPQANPAKGQFRSLIRVSLRNFLRDERAREKAAKRGGNHQFVPLTVAEEQLSSSALEADTNDMQFDLYWARTLVDRALQLLEAHWVAKGEELVFVLFAPWLEEDPAPEARAAAARRLGISLEALRVRVHRFNKQFGELLRSELARTVRAPDQIESELRYLLQVIAASR